MNNYNTYHIGSNINELEKSPLPAGAADELGHYPFFCSGSEPKTISTWLVDTTAILMGTGGIASIHLGKGKFSYSTDTWAFQSKKSGEETEFIFRKLAFIIDKINYTAFEGTGLKHLRKKYIRDLILQLPKPAIQLRINEILSTIDTAIEKTDEVIKKYRQVKSGLMHDLFTRGVTSDGKLRPPREQASELYKETSIGWIPKEWDLPTASSICFPITKGTTPSKFESHYVDELIPFIRVENLSFDGSLNFTLNDLFITKAIHQSELNRSIVLPNDILMNIVGPPLGKVSLISDEFPQWNTNQAIAIYRVKNNLHRKYLLFYLLSKISQKWFWTRSKRTSGQVNLTLELCSNLPVPIPKDDQELTFITKSINIIYLRIAAESKKLMKLQKQKFGLMNDLLSGEILVKSNTKELESV